MGPAWRVAADVGGALLLAAAFAGAILGVAAVMGFHDFFFWAFTGNGGYLDASGVLGATRCRSVRARPNSSC